VHLPLDQPCALYADSLVIFKLFEMNCNFSQMTQKIFRPLNPLVPSQRSLPAEDRGRNFGRIYVFLNMVLIRLRHDSWRNPRFGQRWRGRRGLMYTNRSKNDPCPGIGSANVRQARS